MNRNLRTEDEEDAVLIFLHNVKDCLIGERID